MQKSKDYPEAKGPEARVAELVSEYVEALNRGESPGKEALLGQVPEYRDQLESILEALDVLGPSPDPAETVGHETPPNVPPVVGDFRVVREVGHGAMGVVYEAKQISFNDRTVALKVLSGNRATPRRVERFLREAEAAGELRHANIVPVFCRDEDGGRYFYAMEFVRGYSLESIIHLLRSGQHGQTAPKLDYGSLASLPTLPTTASPRSDDSARPSPPDVAPTGRPLGFGPEFYRKAARLFMDAADGLHYAHRHGVVHRDIKPANLILDEGNRLRITDFGLALDLTEVTASGFREVAGTPPYMSPEQLVKGQPNVDGISDTYSLAITLYELVTLRRAIHGKTNAHVIRNVEAYEPPPPRRINPEVPKDLDTIIRKAISKDRRRRYTDARAFAQDLDNFIEDRPVNARGPSVVYRAWKFARRHRIAVGAIAVALVCLVPSLMYAGRVKKAYDRAVERFLSQRKTVHLQKLFEEAQLDVLADDADAAVSKLTQVIEGDPKWGEALFLRGMALLRKDDLVAAVEDYSRAIDAGPVLAAYYKARANAHRRLKQPELAERDDQAAGAIPPRDSADHFYLGEAHRSAGHYEKAIREYSVAIRLDSKSLPAYFGRAYCRQKLGDNEMAILDYAVVIALRPRYAQAYSNLGEALRRLGRYEEALDRIQYAVTLKPDLEFGHFNLALVEHALGHTQQAEQHYRKALELSPDDPDGYVSLAQLYIEMELPAKAAEIARAGLKRGVRSPALYNNLATALLLSNQPNDAVVYLKNAVDLDPSFADAYFNLGLAYENMGRTDEAIDVYAKALKNAPSMHAARFNLAGLWEKKDPKKAIVLWEQFIDLAQTDPDQKESIVEARKRIERLRSP